MAESTNVKKKMSLLADTSLRVASSEQKGTEALRVRKERCVDCSPYRSLSQESDGWARVTTCIIVASSAHRTASCEPSMQSEVHSSGFRESRRSLLNGDSDCTEFSHISGFARTIAQSVIRSKPSCPPLVRQRIPRPPLVARDVWDSFDLVADRSRDVLHRHDPWLPRRVWR